MCPRGLPYLVGCQNDEAADGHRGHGVEVREPQACDGPVQSSAGLEPFADLLCRFARDMRLPFIRGHGLSCSTRQERLQALLPMWAR